MLSGRPEETLDEAWGELVRDVERHERPRPAPPERSGASASEGWRSRLGRWQTFTALWSVPYFYLTLTALWAARSDWTVGLNLAGIAVWFAAYAVLASVLGVVLGALAGTIDRRGPDWLVHLYGRTDGPRRARTRQLMLMSALSAPIHLALVIVTGLGLRAADVARLPLMDGVRLPLALALQVLLGTVAGYGVARGVAHLRQMALRQARATRER